MSGIADYVSVPKTPDELNAYYLQAAPVVDFIANELMTPDDRIWNQMYNGKVTSYDPAGKGITRRSVTLEHRRDNVTFSTDWEMWKRGCSPQQWNQNTVGRPGTSESWSYLMHMEKQSHMYHLKTVVAQSLNLAKQIEQDIVYLEDHRRDTYAEYFRNFHVTFAGQRWMAWKDSTGGYHFDRRVGASLTAAPWRFGTVEDGCLNTTDRIYVNDAATNAITKVAGFTPKCAKKLQQHYVSTQRNGQFNKVRLITSDVAPTEILEVDDRLLAALSQRSLGQAADSALLYQSLSRTRSIGDLMDFQVDPRVLRYRDTGETDPTTGEFILERVPQFLDINTGSGDQGLRSEENPDWHNPRVAAFEIYVVDSGPIYTPMRPNWPTTIGGGTSFGNRPFAQWTWYNVQDNGLNRDREWGYFALADDMMAEKDSGARNAGVVLVRRRPEDLGLEDIAATLLDPSFENEDSLISCATVQPVCAPPAGCPPTQPGFSYGHGTPPPNCPSCF